MVNDSFVLRFLLYNRYPRPHYQPLGIDTLVDEEPRYKGGKVYRLRLAGSSGDIATWPKFIVIKTRSQVEQQATLVEVFVVMLSEHEPFVEPF